MEKNVNAQDIALNDSNAEVNAQSFANKIAEFAATYQKKMDALRRLLASMNKVDKDDDGDTRSVIDYWLMDADDRFAFIGRDKTVVDDGAVQRESAYFKVGYLYSEEDGAVFNTEPMAVTMEWLTADEKVQLEAQARLQFDDVIEEMKAENQELQSSIDSLKAENAELVAFRDSTLAAERAEAESALFARFDERLQNADGYSDLKENAANFTLEELEEKCNALYGKFSLANERPVDDEPQKATFSKTAADLEGADMDDANKVPYGGLMEAWRSKHQ